MTTAADDAGSRAFSVRLTKEEQDAALNVALEFSAREKKMVSISVLIRSLYSTALAIYSAKTREEALAVAGKLFDSNPRNQEGK